ncbi:hypothetical protein [Erythrobacter sp. F6033]|uniref:hypothetical protein n=1 Tax=Erythrobacter sp. F6033 TaxID=2926401 RepID=UPI001FF1EAA2|nr:hypothetical protein [Erythrobacter sp. F6033]MCK0127077.1 hypothetical protein [Erythrobacter sp. F6033]
MGTFNTMHAVLTSRVALGAYVCVAALALTSCGGGGGSTAPSPTPVQTAPTLTSSTSVSVAENTAEPFYTATATDPQGGTVAIEIFSGPDADKFVMEAGSNIRFNTSPNFDLPTDANGDNIYEMNLRLTAGGGSRTFGIRIDVTNEREGIVVKRVATGFQDPVAIAQIGGQPTLLIAEASGRVLRFDQIDNSIVEDTFIRDFRLPGEILAIGFAFPNGPNQRGVYMVTHSPTEGLLLQAFDPDRNAFNWTKLAEPWSAPTTVSFINQREPLIAVGSPSESDAQDGSTAYGKLIQLRNFNPYAVASVPGPSDMILLPEIIGDGIQRPGGFSSAADFSYLVDQGSSVEHELTILRPEWRPLDFGWPFYEGGEVVRTDPPAAVNGPSLVYRVGDGRKEGQGIIAGQLFRSDFDPAFGDAYVFFDVNGSIFSIPTATLNNGFRNSSDVFEDKTNDFVPDAGQIDTIVGYGAGIASTFFYLLDGDGELFEISQEAL